MSLPKSSALPTPMGKAPEALMAATPAAASSMPMHWRMSALTPSAAARKMSGAGLECATAAGSAMALKKWVSPMRSSRNGAKLSLLPQVFIWAKLWMIASHEPVIEVKPRYFRHFRES